MLAPGLAVLAVSSVATSAGLDVQSPVPAPGSAAESTPAANVHFTGLWVYNEDESVNAATGRPERSPRSATVRIPAARGGPTTTAPAPAGRVGGGGPASGAGVPGASGQPARSSQLGPTVAMIQENRSLTRDLLEVPESLTIKIATNQITFVDDLARQRVYSTDGLKERFQLGAARFNAAVEWEGVQLIKRIDAADGFRMTETYFLSDDAKRLFVIVRVGSSRRNAPMMGVNRVYDRADQ